MKFYYSNEIIYSLETILNTDKFEYDNVQYYIHLMNNHPNIILPIALQNDNILQCANDNFIYKKHDYYENVEAVINDVLYIKNKIINTNIDNVIKITDNCLLLITSFSIGTGHGYSELYSILIKYFDLYPNKELKIAVYKNSQKGILEIINHLFEPSKIIILDASVVYNFTKLIVVPYKYSNFIMEFNDVLEPFIKKNIINKELCFSCYDKVAVIKTEKDISVSKGRDFDYLSVCNYCKDNNIYLINCYELTEIQIANIIFNCKKLFLSWGTNHFKSYPYISDCCENIEVWVLNNSGYSYEYEREKKNNVLIEKYKNAKLNYIIKEKNIFQ
jgi:hypothetical protein